MFFDSVRDVYKNYDNFLIDVFGVLFDGSEFYDGVLDLLKDIKNDGKKIIILSNATLSTREVEEMYSLKGLLRDIHYDEYITSGEAFRYELEEGFKNIISMIGYTPKTYTQIFQKQRVFEGIKNLEYVDNIKFADFVYVGIPRIDGRDIVVDNLSSNEGYSIKLEEIFDMNWKNIEYFYRLHEILEVCLKYNKILVVTNPDLFAHSSVHDENNMKDRNALVIRQGGIAEYYERMGGNVIYFGKPYSPIYGYASRYISTEDKKKIVMIGDTPWTDSLGGNIMGYDTILTLTGISNEFIKNMHKNIDIKDAIKNLLTNISSKLMHDKLKEYSVIPTHIVNKFA